MNETALAGGLVDLVIMSALWHETDQPDRPTMSVPRGTTGNA